MEHKLVCEVCSSNFTSRFAHKKTCNEKCYKERQHRKYGTNHSGLPTNFLGRLHEYQVMIDLGLKKYDVYYSAFPQQHYDLVAINRKNNKALRVEVKTGYIRMTGGVTMPEHSHKDWDILAIVVRAENKIIYFDRNKKIIEL